MAKHISFVSIPVIDQERALTFWSNVMGFSIKVNAEYMPGERWIMLTLDKAQTSLHLELVKEIPDQKKPVLPLVADVPAVVAKLKENNMTIVQDPAPAPWNSEVQHAMFKDSEGNLILLTDK